MDETILKGLFENYKGFQLNEYWIWIILVAMMGNVNECPKNMDGCMICKWR